MHSSWTVNVKIVGWAEHCDVDSRWGYDPDFKLYAGFEITRIKQVSCLKFPDAIKFYARICHRHEKQKGKNNMNKRFSFRKYKLF